MRERRSTVQVMFDGVEYSAYADETILQAANRLGVPIPSLCHLEGLSVHGGCRLCVVQVGQDHHLSLSCATPVRADLEVTTQSPQLRAHRKALVELLFAEGNHVCAVCVSNGNCELQDCAVECEMDHVRFDYQAPSLTVDASHPKYVFDPNRCILCTRCVRVCDEIEGAHVWDVSSRGHQAILVTEGNVPWGEASSCTQCGKCVAVCPTGSLSYQGAAVGEMVHRADMIARLVSARKGDWLDPSAPDDDEGGAR